MFLQNIHISAMLACLFNPVLFELKINDQRVYVVETIGSLLSE